MLDRPTAEKVCALKKLRILSDRRENEKLACRGQEKVEY